MGPDPAVYCEDGALDEDGLSCRSTNLHVQGLGHGGSQSAHRQITDDRSLFFFISATAFSLLLW